MEMKKIINLQLFGEGGGAGASAGAGTGTSGAEGNAVSGLATQGASVGEDTNGDNGNLTNSQVENTAKTPEERQKDFEELIKGIGISPDESEQYLRMEEYFQNTIQGSLEPERNMLTKIGNSL